MEFVNSARRIIIRRLPDDIWMVDLDSNKLTPARVDAELPLLPEPEGTILKNHLKQVRARSPPTPTTNFLNFITNCTISLSRQKRKSYSRHVRTFLFHFSNR